MITRLSASPLCRPTINAVASAVALTAVGAASAQTSMHSGDASALPGIAKDMIDAAAQSGAAADVKAVQAAVRDVLPSFASAIDAYAEETLSALNSAENTTAEPSVAKSADSAANTAVAEAPSSEKAIEETAPTPDATTPTGFWSLKPWDGKLNAGASSATGNSVNTALSFALDAQREAGRLTHNVQAYLNIGEANDILNQKRWGGAYKLDFAFSESTYAFTRVAYDEDQFSGFDYRLFGGAGAGYFLKKSEPLTWSVEGGPGYRYAPIDDTREIDQEFALYAATIGKWVIREGLTFDENARVTWTNSTTTMESTTSLTADLWGSVTTGLSLYYRFETNPPFGRVQTDTVLSATIGYTF